MRLNARFRVHFTHHVRKCARGLHLSLLIQTFLKTFADKCTAAIFEGLQVKRLPKETQGTARRKLKQIDAAGSIESLRVPPDNRLESLKRDRAGQWSIRINDRWRICFRWVDGDAMDVEIADHH